MDVHRNIILKIICVLMCGLLGTCHKCRLTSDTEVDCSGLGLRNIPQNLPVNTTSLNLRYNNITVLLDNVFRHIIKIKHLYLGDNPIATIQRDAFSGLGNLQTLELFRHQLNYSKESLPDDVFSPLTSLQTLTIRSDMSRFNDRYTEFPDKPFGKLKSLVNLNIDTTPTMLFGSAFSNMTNLQKLDIGEFNIPNSKHVLCTIREVTNQTFFNLSSNINYLRLSVCHLNSFEPGSLRPFPNLKTFTFDTIWLLTSTINDIIRALSIYEGKNVSSILITNVYSDTIESGHAYIQKGSILSNICIQHLRLNNVEFAVFEFDVFFFPTLLSKCIRHINLERNHLEGEFSKLDFFLFYRVSNLEIIEFGEQFKFEVSHLSRFQRQPVSKNTFPVPIPAFLPPNIKHIDISSLPTFLGELVDIYFFNGENLRFLNMSYCGLYNFNHTFHGLGNLEVLDFSFNDLSVLNADFFQTFPKLKILRLSGILVDNEFLRQHGNQLFMPLQRLEILDLSSAGLVLLPDNIFDPLINIQQIILTDNKLIEIPDVSSLLQLQYLFFGGNSLTTLKEKARNMLDRTTSNNNRFGVSLYGNTFLCECSSLNMLIWLNDTKVNLDGRNYSCLTSDGKITTTSVIIDDYSNMYRHCHSSFWLNISIACFGLLLLSLITSFMFVKNRMKIRLLLLRMIGNNICPRQRHEFLYDLSILHDESDNCLRFVTGEVVNELVHKRGINFNQNLHIELFTTTAILEDIRDSWKLVLVITERFLNSNLCLFTMYNCSTAITLNTPNRIILFIDRAPVIPANVHFFMDSIAEENIFNVDLSAPLGDEFWSRFTRHMIKDEAL